MFTTIEFSLEKWFNFDELAKEIAFFFNNDVVVADGVQLWEIDYNNKKAIGIDVTKCEPGFHQTLVWADLNFDISRMRKFYFYMSKKYQMGVTFCGCDELTGDFYCLYDKAQNLYHGYMCPSDTEDYEEFIVSGCLEDK